MFENIIIFPTEYEGTDPPLSAQAQGNPWKLDVAIQSEIMHCTQKVAFKHVIVLNTPPFIVPSSLALYLIFPVDQYITCAKGYGFNAILHLHSLS